MSTLDELLGLDPTSPEVLRADLLTENNRRLLDDLVRVRKERGLSQSDVAAQLGVKQPTVADFEAYDSNPTLSGSAATRTPWAHSSRTGLSSIRGSCSTTVVTSGCRPRSP